MTQPERQQPSESFVFRHFSELDGFQALAVIIVVAGHYLEFRVPRASPYFATIDRLGALLFLFLAGF